MQTYLCPAALPLHRKAVRASEPTNELFFGFTSQQYSLVLNPEGEGGLNFILVTFEAIAMVTVSYLQSQRLFGYADM
jgi:hypothetical protein